MDLVDVADLQPEALCREPEQGVQRVGAAETAPRAVLTALRSAM
jgi:hypothetical protein